MLTYACGVLGTRSGRLLGRLLAASRPHMASFKPEELSALVCTAARLKHLPHDGFVSAWLLAFEPHMPTMAGSVLATCGWALATLGVKPGEAWMRAYCKALAGRLAGLQPREVSMVVWALGEWVPVLGPGLVAQLGTRVGQCTSGFDKVVRRNMTWALHRIKTKCAAAAAKRLKAAKSKSGGRGHAVLKGAPQLQGGGVRSAPIASALAGVVPVAI